MMNAEKEIGVSFVAYLLCRSSSQISADLDDGRAIQRGRTGDRLNGSNSLNVQTVLNSPP
jgi:hypothetical protein